MIGSLRFLKVRMCWRPLLFWNRQRRLVSNPLFRLTIEDAAEVVSGAWMVAISVPEGCRLFRPIPNAILSHDM